MLARDREGVAEETPVACLNWLARVILIHAVLCRTGLNKQPRHGNQILWPVAFHHPFDLRLRTAAGQRYVYLVIMYSPYIERAVSPVIAGHLVRTALLCYS